ncbi:MAG: T9SS type A sorting domain-containing protein, partial [Sphingobacteriales bacterium]
VQAIFGTCSSSFSTVQVSIGTSSIVAAGPDVTLNQGATLYLSATGSGGTYNWTGPNGFAATGTSPYLQNITPAAAGNYTVTLQSPGCATTTDIVNVQVIGLSQITGVVFNDANNNNIQDAGESPRPYEMVNLQPGNLWSMTNIQGQYTFHVLPGTYTVSYTAPFVGQTVSPAGHPVTVAGSAQTISDKNFAVYTPAVYNVQVTVVPALQASPGFSTMHSIQCKNIGTLPASGVIKYLPASQLTADATITTAGYTMSGDTLVWSYSNLQPGSTTYRTFYATVGVGTLGNLISSTAVVTPISGDIDITNNYFTLQQTVIGSFDPNDKQVTPAGNITPLQVAAGQDLTYTIRFQNTGTAPAVNVLLVDTISEKADVSTFKMLASSHNNNLTIRDGRVLEWKFNNIMLPDSNSNEPGSHGYVQYQIRPNTSLVLGDEIENTAQIFFDFNEAVVTNTTVTSVALPSGVNGLEASNSLLLYPNPNSGNFTIKLAGCEPGKVTIKLQNLLGQEMHTEAASTNNTAFEHQLNVQELPEGIYLLQVTQNDRVFTKRMVLQR